jgi:hypothetical protein
LFIDEFDRLYEVIDSVLGVFREMKQNRRYFCLHSLIGIGPFSILKLSNRSASPFNTRYAVQSPRWTLEEVSFLFQEFEKERGLRLDLRIIEDVFVRTGGHSALACLCGKAMDEFFLKNKSEIKYDDWIRYATFSLPIDMDRYPTMMKLSDALSEDNPDMKQCVGFLYQTFLPCEGSVEISRSFSEKHRRICEFLTYYGEAFYSIPSPLIRSLLFDRVVQKLTGRPIPSIPPPLTRDYLDIEKLLKTALLSFDESFVVDTVGSSYKIFGNQKVPQEAAYQAELERILRNWLPSRVKISTQHNVGRRKRCDLVITLSDSRFVIEIVASDSVKAVKKHYIWAREYADILNAKECWVLHLTTDPSFDYPFPDHSLDIKVLHVFHDLSLSKFTSIPLQ